MQCGGKHFKDEQDASKKAAAEKAATEKLAARKQGLEKPDVKKHIVIGIKSDPPKEDVEMQENAIEEEKIVKC